MSLRYMLPHMTHRQTTAPPDPRVTAAEAAAKLGISVRTLDRYQAAGTITPCPVPMKPRHFRLSDIEKLSNPITPKAAK